jgi:hypothetical protein
MTADGPHTDGLRRARGTVESRKPTDTMTEADNLAIDRIERLVERAAHHARLGDESTKEFLLAEARIQAMVMDGADDVVTMRYHRYASDSFGVEFELLHGDTELMFGGA